MSSSATAPATRIEVESALRCKQRPTGPLFMPAIYEHKAWFIGSTPTAISRDANLLTKALLAEYEILKPDALAVGVDVYNLEAEAAGCTVTFYGGADASIPGIKPGNHIVRVGDDLAHARLPNPLKDGRMPVNIAAARNVRRALGDNFWLRGAVSGPFSLAISLVGGEALFLACLDNPDWVRSCLEYAARIIREFAKSYIDAGAELIVFDSQASPELLSPPMYEELVLPVTRDFITWAAAQGVRDVPLIIGGNTVPIADMLTRTGANNLLCDFTADFDEWSSIARAAGRALRRNISPRLIETGTPQQIYDFARNEVQRGRDLPGFIMGTAVIPFGTPTESILAIKHACLDAATDQGPSLPDKKTTDHRPLAEAAPKSAEQPTSSQNNPSPAEGGNHGFLQSKNPTDYAQFNQFLYEGRAKEVQRLVQEALAEGRPVDEVLNEGLIAGMSVVGEDFKHNILYVPEVLVAARAMKTGMAVLKPLLTADAANNPPRGTLVMGTVKGDLHDIGKNLVCMMAEGAGFKVIDIGVDQPVENFLAAAREHGADIVGMSALLTTTMPYMKVVIDGFQKQPDLAHVSIAVGGAPVNGTFAEEIGADGYGPDAPSSVDMFLNFVDALHAKVTA